MQQARRLLLLAPLALLGCQKGFEACGDYNLGRCAHDNLGTESTTGDDSTTEPPMTMGTTETTVVPPGCGNGDVEDGEICDDGASNTKSPWELKKTCTDDCMGHSGYCGDGLPNGPEVCDDGDGLNSDAYTGEKHCNAACTATVAYCGDGSCQNQESLVKCPADCASMCGDGELQAGEVCDDGMDTLTCDGDCSKPECGDGYLNAAANEQCDDGNKVDTDACRMDCTTSICGDGVIQAGVELCDDGNQTDDDVCSNACIPARRVFVTTGVYTGGMIKGVAGADTLCKNAAAAVPGLGSPGNTWLAWLSDDSSSPSTRIPPADKAFGGWYLLPGGTPVVKGWSGLTGGTLTSPINRTEAGEAPAIPLAAWTNTNPNGTSAGTSDCVDWTTPDFLTNSYYGDVSSATGTWTKSLAPQACSNSFHLYCLEISPP